MVTNTFLYINNKAPVDPDNDPSEDTDNGDRTGHTFVQHVQSRDSQEAGQAK